MALLDARQPLLQTAQRHFPVHVEHAVRGGDIVGDHRLIFAGPGETIELAHHAQDRSGFAMDWYYPVLAGVMPAAAGLARMESRASRFIVPDRGSRCVASEPWVTVAESCECAMTLVAIGAVDRARTLLTWQLAHRDSDGAFWMGWQFDEQIVWPQEQPGWTQAAAILAFDALQQVTPAWDVLVTS